MTNSTTKSWKWRQPSGKILTVESSLEKRTIEVKDGENVIFKKEDISPMVMELISSSFMDIVTAEESPVPCTNTSCACCSKKTEEWNPMYV
jgi:hypothetical protein